MKSFDVFLTKTRSAKVRVEAETAEEAEDIAFEQFMHGEIELADNGIPGEVDITATEVNSE